MNTVTLDNHQRTIQSTTSTADTTMKINIDETRIPNTKARKAITEELLELDFGCSNIHLACNYTAS